MASPETALAAVPAENLPQHWRTPYSLGWSVIPVEQGGKLPVGKWKAYQQARAEVDTVAVWASRPCNIGVVTGAVSGLIVLDLDSAEAVEAAKARGLPETVTVRTAKGLHVYFSHPGGTIGNRTGIFPGADIRGDGGFVVAAGSVHPTGAKYEWEHPPGLFDLAPPPQWLLDLLAKPQPVQSTQNAAIDGGRNAYGERAIDNELSALRKASNGSRNDALNRAAFNLAQLAAGGVIDEQSTLNHLRSTASAIGLEPDEIEATLESGWKAGSEQPRRPEPRPQSRATNFQQGGSWANSFDPETGEVTQGADTGAAVCGTCVEPVDLWRRYSTPELPEGLLPTLIEDFARKHGAIMGVDAAGLAMAAMAVSSAAISDEIKLQVKQHDPTWLESARLWVGLVGTPSMKKTPIINAAVRPLRRIDANLMRAYTEKAVAYEALTPKERKAATRPRQERRMISDATIEAAQEVLRDSPRGVLSVQDELSGWFGAMDKYSPGKGAMADRSFWLQAFNGGSYSLNRISRGASYIPNCSIGLLGGVQPEPIRAIASDTHDDGLVQRLLPVILRPGSAGKDVPADGVVEAYERLIERMEVMQPPTRQGVIPFDGQPLALRFDARARTVRERLETEHLGLVRALEAVSPKLAAHFGKYDGLFARLCVLWHCIETDGPMPAAEVSLATAERVERFMADFIRPSAIAFYAGLLGLSAGHEDLLSLAAWIVAADVREVKARDVQSSSQSFRHVTADQVRVLCEKLEAFGWGEWHEPGPKSNKPRFIINPLVHERFAHRGAEEQARRAAVRDAIAQTLGE